MDGNPFTGGSGARLTKATVIVAGVACLASSILSILYVVAVPMCLRVETGVTSLADALL